MIGVAVAVTRLNYPVFELRRAVAWSNGGRMPCRSLAIAQVLDGASRAEAAAAYAMVRQTRMIEFTVTTQTGSRVCAMHRALDGRMPCRHGRRS